MLGQLGSQDAYAPRRFDADPHRLAFHLQNGHDDLISDLNLLTSLARKNEHGTLRSLTMPGLALDFDSRQMQPSCQTLKTRRT
jgi:hypothetical protein